MTCTSLKNVAQILDQHFGHFVSVLISCANIAGTPWGQDAIDVCCSSLQSGCALAYGNCYQILNLNPQVWLGYLTKLMVKSG